MLNLRPDYRYWLTGHPHGLGADLYLLWWLDHLSVDYEVLTDEAVHHRGLDLLANYDAVLTGGHPEYITTPLMEAYTSFLDGGGRLMYLGSNGFANGHGGTSRAPVHL